MSIIKISDGTLVASINSVGSSLVGLIDGNFHLVEPNTKENLYPGSVLAPWPNRIRDGRYQFRNQCFQLPINEVSRNNALHGLVAYQPWQVDLNLENEVKFEYQLSPSTGYPGRLNLNSHFKIKEKKLTVTITACNIGNTYAPYGVSIHTYLLAGRVIKNNDLTLKIPANEYLDVDPNRLLPSGLKSVVNSEFDFQKGKVISNLFIDHAFKYTQNSPRLIELIDPQGEGVVMEFDSFTNWIQVHTADRDGGENSRKTVAIEPMSCPPDAFNSKVDLIELAPGDTHSYQIKIWRKVD